MITEHTVCALPEDNVNWRHYAIQARRRLDGRWIVHHVGSYLDETRNPEDCWTPSAVDATTYDEAEALKTAEWWSVGIEVNGITVDQALARSWR